MISLNAGKLAREASEACPDFRAAKGANSGARRFNSGSEYFVLPERVVPNYERKQRDLNLEVASRDRLGMKRGKVCGSERLARFECVHWK